MPTKDDRHARRQWPGDSDKRLLAVRAVLAMCGLAAGVAIYVLRPTSIHPLDAAALQALPATVTGSAPSALHAFSFILLTSLFLPNTRVSHSLNALAWVGLEVGCELLQCEAIRGQLPTALAALALSTGLSRCHSLRGVFDVNDLVAIVAGAAFAFFQLTQFERSPRCARR